MLAAGSVVGNVEPRGQLPPAPIWRSCLGSPATGLTLTKGKGSQGRKTEGGAFCLVISRDGGRGALTYWCLASALLS